MTREECLDKAKAIVTGQREQDYGTPEFNFNFIARLWSEYLSLGGTLSIHLNATDVAMMMVLLKVARIHSNKATEDSFVDIAGYAACAAEVSNG